MFVAVSALLIVALPRLGVPFFRRYGDRVIEPGIKPVFAGLFGLMVLADKAQSHAVLPAFVLGLVMSCHYQRHRREQERLRVVAFVFLTPFFFLRGGMNVSLGAVFAKLGVLALLAAAKLVPKLGLVLPLARRHVPDHATFTTLLMSTGLTFGPISSLYGLNAQIIDRTRFSLLVTVVVLSAIVPTAIAQRFFSPDVGAERRRHSAADLSRRLRPRPGEGRRRHGRHDWVLSLGARLTVLAVEGMSPINAASVGKADEGKRKEEFFARVLGEADAEAQQRGVEARAELVSGHAAEVITHCAAAHGHDLIVVGYRGHFMGDVLLGSTADRVAHRADCPVMVVR